MRALKSLTVMLALALWAAVVPAQQRRPAHQFQQAIDLMETKGDLPAAIRLFEQVAKGPDRALAARSLLYAGQCYEKLGNAQVREARKAYERVVREFADQPEQVRLARARIAALQAGGANAGRTEMKLRRVWTTGSVDFGRISPDGRFLSFTDWESDDESLTIHDFATGENRRLTGKGTTAASSRSSGGSVLSPDSKQIAYNCYTQDGFEDLRIIGIDGSEPRLLYSNREQVRRIEPAAWSPDGRYILAGFQKKDETWGITLVAVSDGSVRPLKPVDRYAAQRARFSPDGRYIAYDARGDIFLLETGTGRELPWFSTPRTTTCSTGLLTAEYSLAATVREHGMPGSLPLSMESQRACRSWSRRAPVSSASPWASPARVLTITGPTPRCRRSTLPRSIWRAAS